MTINIKEWANKSDLPSEIGRGCFKQSLCCVAFWPASHLSFFFCDERANNAN